MKKLIALLFILIFSVVAYAAPRTGYYEHPTTKESVWNYAKEYEKLFTSKGVQITTSQNTSKYNYVNEWIYKSSGATLNSKVHYQYFDDKIVVNIMEAGLTPDGKAKMNITDKETDPARKQVYDALEKMIIDSFFTNLKLSDTKPTTNSVRKVTEQPFIENGYDYVTRDYKANQTKEQAKEQNMNYINNILKPSFQVTFLSDKNADNFDVKYFKNDEGGISTTIIVNYKFQNNAFSISMKSVEVLKNADGSKIIVNKYINTDPQKPFYEYLKSFFVDVHANYIAPK